MRRYLSLVLLVLAATPTFGQSDSTNLQVGAGYVTTPDGVRLFYQRVGSGAQLVILPARLFLIRDFRRLAKGRTLIFYDMRDRGRSDAVKDPKKIGIQDDVNDLEWIRRHFGIEKPNLIGFSYLGMMVMLYATEFPDHVGRIVQIGPVPRRFDAQYPPELRATDGGTVPDPVAMKKLEEMEKNGDISTHPREFCEKEWEITRVQLVGDPANAAKLGPSKCDMPNEWPVHLYPHFEASMASIQTLDLPKEKVARLRIPVLTIHGTRDRNAPYGSGREWAMDVGDGRLVTVLGAAHMSWVEAPDLVFSSIETFLNGEWPAAAERINQLEIVPTKQ
jgi:proline iminopeptidase